MALAVIAFCETAQGNSYTTLKHASSQRSDTILHSALATVLNVFQPELILAMIALCTHTAKNISIHKNFETF